MAHIGPLVTYMPMSDKLKAAIANPNDLPVN